MPQRDRAAAQPASFDFSEPIASATLAWHQGDFVGCLRALDGLPVPDNTRQREDFVLVRARALLRVDRPAEALDLLESTVRDFERADAAAIGLMLLGSATARCESEVRGLKILEEAASFARRGDVDAAIAVEIDYYRALAYRAAGDMAAAVLYAARAASADAGIISARAIALQGWLRIDAGDLSEALGSFLAAKNVLLGCGIIQDVHLGILVEKQIALLESELASADVRGHHRERQLIKGMASLIADDAAPIEKFWIQISDAWLFAIDGDAVRATDCVWDAEAFATSDAWRVFALAERAAIARAVGEVESARRTALAAYSLSRHVDWNTRNEERNGLLSLAEELAQSDDRRASEVMVAFRQSAGTMDHLFGPAIVQVAQESYVTALIERSVGNFESATVLLREAYRGFRKAGSLRRCVLTLIELDRTASPLGTQYAWALETATMLVRRHFPKSYLVPMLGKWAHSFEDEIAAALPPYLRETLRLLVVGHKPKTIAQRTGREYHTVRGYVSQLRAAFGVHSVSDLLLEAGRRGLA